MTRTNEIATPEERRALDAEELGLADMTRPPRLSGLGDGELTQVIQRLRDRRNRARDLSDRQSREARAKVDPAGVTASRGNAGMLSKHDYLDAALDRAMQEQDRRNAPSQAELARKAQEMKAGGPAPSAMAEDGSPLHPHDPDSSSGKAQMARTARNVAPSGALDHAGELPSRERSRTRY
ncbi:hypothetical protein [Paracoccus sp. (in: a-proteobacteria)]|uniref:hypothetical protein n=1 Tax=Paracoccus sp. TaxID=267 RepID=UPI00272C4F13|nr:hypothetical protein [Paracoccus sp. (in: a-proteobacteria)]